MSGKNWEKSGNFEVDDKWQPQKAWKRLLQSDWTKLADILQEAHEDLFVKKAKFQTQELVKLYC